MIIISKVCLRPGVNLLMAIAVCRKAALTHGPTMDPVMAERTMMMMVVVVVMMVVVIAILMRMIALHGKTILKNGLMRPVIEWMAMITVMMVTMPTMMMIMMISMCIITLMVS